MSQAYRVVLSGNARDDLRDIGLYISQTFGSRNAALKQTTRIRNAIESLETMPLRHALASDARLAEDGVRRMNVGNFAVLYTVDEKSSEVVVARVMYGRRNMKGVLSRIHNSYE